MTTHDRLETPSGRVHVAEWGRGHPVVMIHGLFASSASFDHLLARLPEGRRGLAIDLPGFGESTPAPGFAPSWERYASAVIEAVDALELGELDLVGHSMGGGIAALVAARLPERVRRLVLVDAVVFPFDVPFKGRLPLVPVLGEALFRLYGERMFVRYFEGDVFHDPARMDRERVLAWYRIFAANRATALAALRATADPDKVARVVGGIRAPTLAVWGERDAIIPLALGHRLEAAIPGARLHVVPDCGHAPLEERPELACPPVVEFLERSG
jgi:pimeloyl-ACP methyl ester carboxylesterase